MLITFDASKNLHNKTSELVYKVNCNYSFIKGDGRDLYVAKYNGKFVQPYDFIYIARFFSNNNPNETAWYIVDQKSGLYINQPFDGFDITHTEYHDNYHAQRMFEYGWQRGYDAGYCAGLIHAKDDEDTHCSLIAISEHGEERIFLK